MKKMLKSQDGENVVWTSDPTVEIPIRMSKDANHMGALPAITVIDVFKQTLATKGDYIALKVKFFRDNSKQLNILLFPRWNGMVLGRNGNIFYY